MVSVPVLTIHSLAAVHDGSFCTKSAMFTTNWNGTYFVQQTKGVLFIIHTLQKSSRYSCYIVHLFIAYVVLRDEEMNLSDD